MGNNCSCGLRGIETPTPRPSTPTEPQSTNSNLNSQRNTSLRNSLRKIQKYVQNKVLSNPENSTSHSTSQNINSSHSPHNSSKPKNKPLQRNLHKITTKGQLENTWTSEQLKNKREEFWDTAPAYEGREEIWQALKAAVENINNGNSGSTENNNNNQPNYEMAQIIIDSAGISTPYGTFDCCYDELGTMYQIPIWVVSNPNGDNGEAQPDELSESNQASQNKLLSRIGSIRTSIKNKILGNQTDNLTSTEPKCTTEFNSGSHDNKTISSLLKEYNFRLMNYSEVINDFSIEMDHKITISNAKIKLAEEIIKKVSENSKIDENSQDFDEKAENVAQNTNQELYLEKSKKMTWFCAGRVLQNNLRLKDCNISDGFLIQVHIR